MVWKCLGWPGLQVDRARLDEPLTSAENLPCSLSDHGDPAPHPTELETRLAEQPDDVVGRARGEVNDLQAFGEPGREVVLPSQSQGSWDQVHLVEDQDQA